ncbi:DUF397 domain-containing protein [Streptomyces sp. SID4919]|uniref:DUF397 domain-containing protein n=1 Tax=unclassified Streptomyces TaxID=2593676 RepID=UPI000823F2A7|nr:MULTISPECIES: DUF397 domain-containing protein [unclassified Streptomyces]MYY10911.1 DUF397 domain-containing protein [Streptomyces sp. SID4919]SCK56431.1 protein of unknown function [Streptomyces sp. AmelKG-E11A]
MSRGPVAAYDTGLAWFKSSHSDSSSGSECVEVAAAPGAVLVRDSKDASGPRLGFTRTAWADFVPYAIKS